MSIVLTATQLASSSGSFEPQRKNNWSLEVFGLNSITAAAGSAVSSSLLTLTLNTGFLPAEMSEAHEIPYGNERVFFASRGLFEAGQITVRDYVDIDTINLVKTWRRSVYDERTGIVGLASAYKKTGHIVLAAPDGSSERLFELLGLWPEAFNPGPLDMSDGGQIILEVGLRYDKAIYTGPYNSGT